MKDEQGPQGDAPSVGEAAFDLMTRDMDEDTRGRLRDYLSARLPAIVDDVPGLHGPEEPVETGPEDADALAMEVSAALDEADEPAEFPRPRKSRNVADALDGHWCEFLRQEVTRAAAPVLRTLADGSRTLRPMSVGVVRCAAPGMAKRVADVLGGTAVSERSEGGKRSLYRTVVMDEAVLSAKKGFETPRKMDEGIREYLRDGNAVVLVTSSDTHPGTVSSNLSWTLRLDDLAPRVMWTVARMRASGFPLDRSDGSRFEDGWGDTSIEYERIGAVHGWLLHVYGDGRPVSDRELDDLRVIAEASLGKVPASPSGPTTFAEVPGLGRPLRERLSSLALRMAGPARKPPGVILDGPPGGGKTMLAGILARDSGRHFVKASVAEWQTAGYLNDTLAAMRDTFAEARRHVPSLVFLDELDSIGTRGRQNDRNDQYWTIVINAFLEHLQGLGGRGDVVVIGATNHIGLIDPAILRAGRLGEHVHVPLPDRSGRREILDFYLPRALRGRVDTLMLADRFGECGPADIEAFVDEITATAGGDPRPGDVELAFARMGMRLSDGLDLSRLRPSISYGLAARALVASVAYGPDVRIDGISALPGLADLGRVSMTHVSGAFPRDTAGDLRRALHVQVAGPVGRLVASRSLVGRAPHAALDAFSPATSRDSHAAEVTARLLVRSGATGVLPEPTSREHLNEERVATELAAARRHVRDLLVRLGPVLMDLADALVRDGVLDASTFARLSGHATAAPTVH